jgi:predicted nucleotide-binding protein (sugar kinase/HSP70/actin superfamily)
MKIAIPRAGLYYYYQAFWTAFFEALDFEVVISDKTDRKILKSGLTHSHSEMCLPMKIFYGHVVSLSGRADYILIPQFEEFAYSGDPDKREYFCPYFVAMPDMFAAEYPELKILRPVMKFLDDKIVAEPWLELAQQLGKSEPQAQAAYDAASQAQAESSKIPDKFDSQGKPIIVVIGRPYLIYDEQANSELLAKIRARGYEVMSVDDFAPSSIEQGFSELQKYYHYHWRLTNREYGAIIAASHEKGVKGIIYATPFNCGPDFLMEMFALRLARRRLPVISISFDESTGEAGLITRLDAFFDMLK